MLIYFDVPSQGEAMDILTGLLKEDGILFLGHAESGVLLDRDYEPVEAKGSFAFRKVKRRNERISFLTDTQKIYKAELDRQLSARKRKYIEKEKVVKKVKKLLRKEEREPEARKMENFLDKAKAYADRGMLEEAENICRQHMAENKLDPEAYFLLGLISMSLRKYSDAEGFFNKTVYLKPDHYDALINLSAIKERAGDHKAALRFRDRAERTGAFKK
jgi:chemotaxis protein methyltransferase WspC